MQTLAEGSMQIIYNLTRSSCGIGRRHGIGSDNRRFSPRMTSSGVQLLGRAASLPLSGDTASVSRRSLECLPCGTLRSRRSSVDVRAGRGDSVLATSVLSARVREGVQLEVGRSVDVNEQRRRLEYFWNTEEPREAREPELAEESTSGSCVDHVKVDPRSHLEERWRNQSRHSDKARGAQSSLTALRAGRRKRSRSLVFGRLPAVASRCNASAVSPEEADLQLLTKLVGSAPGSSSSATTKLLGKSAELELGRIVQLGLQTRQTLDALEQETGHTPSSREQEDAVGVPAENIDLRLNNQLLAQQLFVRYNTRLLYKVARMHEGRGLDLEDLVAEGINGLERAIQRFDPSKGNKFSTCAYMWIRQAIGRSVHEHARVVRLPSHVHETLSRIQKARDLLLAQQREATDQEVAAVLGEPVQKVREYAQASRSPLSLETANTSDPSNDDLLLAESIQDETPTAMDELEEEDSLRLLKRDIDEVLSGLSLRERNVLRYRYGLLSDAMTLGELSAAYGVSKDRIKSIGEVALAKLQLRQASNGKTVLNGRVRNVPVLQPELYL